MSNKLPDNSEYVVAAYLVFFALLLIYFAIMNLRLSRLERDVVELNELADKLAAPAPAGGSVEERS